MSIGFESGGSEDSPDSNSESNQASLFAGYSVVNAANLEIQRDLEEWSQIAASNVEQAQKLPAESPLGLRILSNARLIATISEDILFEPENFRGVRDLAGSLQAAATVIDRDDHLYLDYLATAPWNVTRNSPLCVRESATALVVELVKESVGSGYKGRIIVNAVAGSSSFYERIGFVATGFGSVGAPEMELTSEAAKRLLVKYGVGAVDLKPIQIC